MALGQALAILPPRDLECQTAAIEPIWTEMGQSPISGRKMQRKAHKTGIRILVAVS
jgi:hypothetical protein